MAISNQKSKINNQQSEKSVLTGAFFDNLWKFGFSF